MKDKEFLEWLIDRLIYVYKESPDVDFVLKLKAITKQIPESQLTPNVANTNIVGVKYESNID